jgi:anti-sigma regulatory factor (Ser/Thr protein kinase)
MSCSPQRHQVVLEREYDGTVRTLHAARTDVVGCLTASGIGQDLQERAELVVSELASNAVQASPGNPYNLRLAVTLEGTVVMALTSRSNNGKLPSRDTWGPASVLAVRGRGLMIVDELADRVVVAQPVEGTVVVTATLR